MSEPTFDMSAAATQLDNAFAGDSAPVVEPAVTTPEPTPVVAAPQQGGHPAWNEILSSVPQSLHDVIRPKLEAWDKGVESKLQQVHSQYDPYKDFIGTDPGELRAAQQLFNVLNTNPRALYEQLAQHYGFGGEQGQNADDELDLSGDEDYVDPRIDQLAQQQQLIMQQMQAAQEAQLQQQASAWLDTTMSNIEASYKQRGINPDMEYIVTVAAGLTGANPNLSQEKIMEMAVAKHDEALQRFSGARTAAASAPNVLSPTGSVPSSNFDPSKLSEQDRKTMAADMLRNAFKG